MYGRTKIEGYIETLVQLTNLTREELMEKDDDVSAFIPECISNTVLILGNHFDEYLSILIKESKRLLNECYVKKIDVVDVSNIMRQENIDKTIKDNMNLILQKDIYDLKDIHNDIITTIDEYYVEEIKYIPCTTLGIYESRIKPIEENIDRVYLLSKQFAEWCVEKVKYNYAYNYKISLEDIGTFVIDSIIYLFKYYLTLLLIFKTVITNLNESLITRINR